MLFDWLRHRRADSASSPAWTVRKEGAELVAEDGRGGTYRLPLSGARNVRVVPLTGGNHHIQTSGWQVALGRADGDLLLGKPLADWQTARELARLVCERTELPLDELTERMFSRVGQFQKR